MPCQSEVGMSCLGVGTSYSYTHSSRVIQFSLDASSLAFCPVFRILFKIAIIVEKNSRFRKLCNLEQRLD